jgi:hypothetical protein
MVSTGLGDSRMKTGHGHGRPPIAVLVLCLAGGLLVGACEGSDAWDQAFRKRYWGWMAGDGGATIKIGTLLLWVFGDTFAHADGQQAAATRNFSEILGNTIALHPLNGTTPPWNADGTWNSTSQEIRFYGRSWPVSPNPPATKDITYTETVAGTGPLGFSNTAQFFGSSCSGVGGPQWPAGGIYQSSRLALFTYFINYDSWAPIGHTIQKYTNVNTTSVSSWTCEAPGSIPNQYTTTSPDGCTLNQDPPLNWGVAVVKIPSGQTDAGHTYIYGTKRQACPTCSACQLYPGLIVAKVESDSEIYNYPRDTTPTGWKFRYRSWTSQCLGGVSCWSSTPPTSLALRNELHFVTGSVSPEFSIERVTHSGQSRWVLLHSLVAPLKNPNGSDYTGTIGQWLQNAAIANFREIVMRSSDTPLQFPGVTQGAKKYTSGVIMGSTARADIIANSYAEPGTGTPYGPADPKVVSGYNAYRNIHAVRGHRDISSAASINVSYYVWDHKRCSPSVDLCNAEVEKDLYYSAADAGAANNNSPPTDGHLGASISSFRFLEFPLKYVHPWCAQQSPNTCP